eukprot:IDg21553t1
MDPVVLGGLELLVAWKSEVDPEPEAGLGQCPWGLDISLSAVGEPDRAMENNTTTEREQKEAVVKLSVGL